MDSPALARRQLLLAAAALSVTPGAAWAAGGKSKDEPLEPYLRVAALAAQVRLTGGRRGVITVEPGVEASDPVLRLLVEQSVPRLRAGWFAVLQRYAEGLRPGTAPDVDQLARALQVETDRVLGRRGARFLIGSVLIH